MSYLVVYDTIHLWQNYSVDEVDTITEAIQKQKEHPEWQSMIAEVVAVDEIEIPDERLKVLE